jgi:hypothetical protein
MTNKTKVAGRRDNAQMMAYINQPVSKHLTQAKNSITMFNAKRNGYAT